MGIDSAPTEQLADCVLSVIRRRRSTRRFLPQPVQRELLLELVEAGVWAPSGSNWQNQRFLILDDPAEISQLGHVRFVWPYKATKNTSKSLSRLHPDGIIGEAPAAIVVFSDSMENDRRGQGEYYLWQTLEIQNCAASIQNILLAATARRLASCWVSASDEMNYTRLLSKHTWTQALPKYHIPASYRIQGIVLVGFPAHVDAGGFPQGEKKHGATIWRSTSRRDASEYLIKATAASGAHPTTTGYTHIRLRMASTAIRILLSAVRRLDKYIHRIEIRTRHGNG